MKIKPAGNCAYYGLTEHEWMTIFRKQGCKCAICGKQNMKWVTDHEHVRGWKKMPPEQRKLYVRGILCLWCNFRILRRGVTIQKLENALNYLKAYEKLKSRRVR